MPTAVADELRLRVLKPDGAPRQPPQWPGRIPRAFRIARRKWRWVALGLMVALLASAGAGLVWLRYYQPFQLDTFVTCCNVGGEAVGTPRPIAVGGQLKTFVFVSQLIDSGRVGVRLESLSVEYPDGLSSFVRQGQVGYITDRNAGLGEPVIPFHPFELGAHQRQDIIFRGDISHCPVQQPGMHEQRYLVGLVVHWSTGPVHHTTRLPLDQTYVFSAAAACG